MTIYKFPNVVILLLTSLLVNADLSATQKHETEKLKIKSLLYTSSDNPDFFLIFLSLSFLSDPHWESSTLKIMYFQYNGTQTKHLKLNCIIDIKDSQMFRRICVNGGQMNLCTELMYISPVIPELLSPIQ